jgi:hypothetical protein
MKKTLAQYLELSDAELEELGIDYSDLTEDISGSSSKECILYFNVPDDAPPHILGKKRWSVGQRIEVERAIVNQSNEE